MRFRKICVIFKAPTSNDSLEPLVARQHNARASHHKPAPRSTMAGPRVSAHKSGRLGLPLGRDGGSAADMSLTSSDWAQSEPVGRLCSLEPDGPRVFVGVLYGEKKTPGVKWIWRKTTGGAGWILDDREADGLWKGRKKYLRSTQQGAKTLECRNNFFKKVRYHAKFFLPMFCQRCVCLASVSELPKEIRKVHPLLLLLAPAF